MALRAVQSAWGFLSKCMARRRMFNSEIVQSDAFLDMSQGAQALYFHLGMSADDEGFLGNPKRVMKSLNAQEDDYTILKLKRFVIEFESGVVVIKHWLMHNTIRMDRFNPTTHIDEKALVYVKENRSYTLENKGIPLLATKWQPKSAKLAPQVKLIESNIIESKDSLTAKGEETIKKIREDLARIKRVQS